MKFYYDPKKARTAFIITLVLAIVFFVISGVLGYFYYQAKSLDNWKEKIVQLKDGKITELEAKVADLEGRASSLSAEGVKTKADLEKENASLNAQIASYKAKIAKANAYNEFYKYLNQVIEAHNGFSGWTDAEFQVGKTKAEATGDASFVSDVNWAWYETSVDPNTRVMKIWKDIASGIENSLK